MNPILINYGTSTYIIPKNKILYLKLQNGLGTIYLLGGTEIDIEVKDKMEKVKEWFKILSDEEE